jgi:hypothetical protein
MLSQPGNPAGHHFQQEGEIKFIKKRCVYAAIFLSDG